MKQLVPRLPTIGIICFVGLYGYATTRYPGGSQANLDTEGFDWLHNYWCNLLNEKGMNGQPNPARPFSILAMFILCGSLAFFFVQFAEVYSKNWLWKRMIKIGGILSMFFALLIFTPYHDLMTSLSSIFGCFVVIGIIREIYRGQWLLYKISGLCCMILLGLNNYIYYTGHYLEFLPLLQKVSFVLVLLWVVGLNGKLIRSKARRT